MANMQVVISDKILNLIMDDHVRSEEDHTKNRRLKYVTSDRPIRFLEDLVVL